MRGGGGGGARHRRYNEPVLHGPADRWRAPKIGAGLREIKNARKAAKDVKKASPSWYRISCLFLCLQFHNQELGFVFFQQPRRAGTVVRADAGETRDFRLHQAPLHREITHPASRTTVGCEGLASPVQWR